MIIRIPDSGIATELNNLGVHPIGAQIMQSKGCILPLKLLAVRTPAANILKQEMLAAGGDCAVPLSAVTCSSKYCDLLLLGTMAQYQKVIAKLSAMSYFGLQQWRKELEALLTSEEPVTRLADGRVLNYKQMVLMGIINTNDDSFFAASRMPLPETAVKQAEKMLIAGAGILDIGGESSRPGAQAVSTDIEQQRVIPIIKAINKDFPQSIISVDTYHAATAEAAIEAGAQIINDISAGEYDRSMAATAVKYQTPLIIMHNRGTPEHMQQDVHYDNVVDEIASYLFQKAETLLEQGLTREQLIIDPGIGFAKTTEDNLRLLKNLTALTGHGLPVLLGASRKTVIGEALGNLAPQERLEGTIALSCLAAQAGINIVRVHDVEANVRAVRMIEAVYKCQ